MTLEIETDGTEAVTRRPRSERPARQVHREDDDRAAAGAVIDGVVDSSPESALANTRQQIESQNRELASARRAAREADLRREAAERQAAQAIAGQVNSQHATVNARLEAAKNAQKTAATAIRTARESGDVEAEISAQEQLADATWKLNSATAEADYLRRVEAQRPQQRTQQPAYAPSDAARRWLEDHPAFETDEDSRAVAEGAHNAALRAGHAEGSEAYVNFIDQKCEKIFGAGHGRGQSQQRQPGAGASNKEAAGMDEYRGAGGASAPPSRDSGSRGGGWRTVETAMGPVQVLDKPGGGLRVRFSSTEQLANATEGASWTPGMSIEEFMQHQIDEAAEVSRGQRGTLQFGEGRTYK